MTVMMDTPVMRNRTRKYSKPFEIEYGRATVEYLIEFTVTPGERETRDCPGSDPEIEDRAAYVEIRRGGKATLERRPELDDLVSDEELLDYAADDAGDDHDRAYDDWRDRRAFGEDY